MSEYIDSKEKIRTSSYANNIIAAINEIRKSKGLRELYAVPYLDECAKIRSAEIMTQYSYIRPNGEEFSSVIDYTKFEYDCISEYREKSIGFKPDQIGKSIFTTGSIYKESITHIGCGVTLNNNAPLHTVNCYMCVIVTNDLNVEVEHDGQYLPERTTLFSLDLFIYKPNINDRFIIILESDSNLSVVTSTVEFNLLNDCKSLTFTSDIGGELSSSSEYCNKYFFEDLPYGDYKIYVQRVPDGYELPDTINFSPTGTAFKSLHIFESIGAFENAEKLRKIIIPESVKKIGTKSFSGTALKSVKIASDCEYSAKSFPESCEIKFYE